MTVDRPQKILIDTDPGIDDAMAIVLALRAPSLDVIGLTTVYGNHRLPVTTRNALRLREAADRGDLPVVPGADQPLVRPRREIAVHVHGWDGLGDVGLPAPQGKALDEEAAAYIVRQVLAHPGEITLLAIGPLTNLALALQKDERIVKAVREVVVMGGAFNVAGNVTPSAEANVHADPQAAAQVFNAGWPLTLVGLDVTERCQTDRAFMRALGQAQDPTVRLLGRIFPVYEQYHRRQYGLDGGTYIHDPAAVAYLLDRTLFRTVRGRVTVEAEGPHPGRTVLDGSVKQGACRVCIDVDAARVLDALKVHLIE